MLWSSAAISETNFGLSLKLNKFDTFQFDPGEPTNEGGNSEFLMFGGFLGTSFGNGFFGEIDFTFET